MECKDCKKRFVGCHSVCEVYARYKAEKGKKHNYLKKENAVYMTAFSHRLNCRERNER